MEAIGLTFRIQGPGESTDIADAGLTVRPTHDIRHSLAS